MYWNILVWLRIEIPDGFLHQISENLKIDDLVTGGTINLQLTLQNVYCLLVDTTLHDARCYGSPPCSADYLSLTSRPLVPASPRPSAQTHAAASTVSWSRT